MPPHSLLIAPFLDEYLVLRPGYLEGLRIPRPAYLQLRDATRTGQSVPSWLASAAADTWGLALDRRPAAGTVLVREESPHPFGRASYEVNLGCNYACEHCYLGLKTFAGLAWPQRERLLHILRDAGVLWLQLTGGEPLIDKLYAEVHTLAYELGMMIAISTNGSRLANPKILDHKCSCSAGDDNPY